MEINHKVLEKLGRLSALKTENSQELADYLSKTLSYFEQINRIDTEKVPALINPLELPMRLRVDQAVDFPDKAKLLDQAPKKQGNLIKAPATV